MKLKVYTKPECPYCIAAKKYLDGRGWPYKEVEIGKDIDRDTFIGLYPDVKKVPFILVNEKPLGGFDDLKEYAAKFTTQREVLVFMLEQYILDVVFTKKDGTTRKMRCTRMESLVPGDEKGTNIEETDRIPNPEVMVVWDLDKQAWRSFRLDSTISFTISTELNEGAFNGA